MASQIGTLQSGGSCQPLGVSCSSVWRSSGMWETLGIFPSFDTTLWLHSGEKLRCMGSGLSPNGLPFSGEGVVSLALLDNIKYLDLQKGRITVEAGARIQPVSPTSSFKVPASCVSRLLVCSNYRPRLEGGRCQTFSLKRTPSSSKGLFCGRCN